MPFYVEVLCRCWGVPYKWAVFYGNRELFRTFGSEQEAEDYADNCNDLYYEAMFL